MITGTNLAGAWVTIAGVTATVVTSVDTRVEARAPASTSGLGLASRAVDVDVMNATGTKTVTDGYTYRGIAFVFIRGMTSDYTEGEIDPSDPFTVDHPNGLARDLVNRGIPEGSFHQFSYDPDSPSYGCEDTLGHIATSAFGPSEPVRLLHEKVRAIADATSNVDVYLVGHSQGGVVAMAYLAYLQHVGQLTSEVPGTTGSNLARLAGVITLDSPLGGIAPPAGLVAFLAKFKPGCTYSGALPDDALDFMRLFRSAWPDSPLGGNAWTGRVFYGSDALGTNDTMAGNSGDREPPSVLTIGNTADCAFWTGVTTQWVTNTSQRVFARSINDGDLWLCVKFGLAGVPANHERVLRSDLVADAIWALINGEVPPTGGGIEVPAATSASSIASAPAIVGTITGAGGAPLANADVAAISTDTGAATSATTDGEGSYALPLAPETYLVAVHDPSGGHAPGYAAAGGGFTTDFDTALRVVVGASDVTVDVALVAAHLVSGTVTSGPSPLVGLAVEARDETGVFVTGALTVADGTYELVLADGTYLVRVEGGGQYASGYYGPAGYAASAPDATPVVVADDHVTGIDLSLPTIAHVAGMVTDGSGAPLEGILVAARNGDRVWPGITGADGSYTMPVDPGSYIVSFEDPARQYATGYYSSGGYVADETAATDVEVGLADVPAISVALPGLPDLTLAKTHTGTFSQGDTGRSYTLTVTNAGAAPTAGTVTVADTLPAGLIATALSGSGWSCTLATLTCTRSDALAAGASYPAITLTVDVAPDAPAAVTNTAAVSGGGELNVVNSSAADPTTIVALPATGFLRVTGDPAVPAQISLNGEIADSWGLTWVKVPPGSYTVAFSHVEGFSPPAEQTVNVSAGATTTVTGTFTRRGSLRVVTSPAVGGRISVDGMPRNNWGMWTDVPAGQHQVCFGPVAGFTAPACQTATVTAGQLTTVTGTYTANGAATGATNVGFLRVTTDPAVPAQISLNGEIADSWGLTWLELAPGQYTVHFSHVEGFSPPADQTVTVTADQTTTVTGTYTRRGSLRVVTSPAVAATITVDGVARNDWGMWTDIPTGQHEVCFGAVAGFTAPACQTVTVTAGGLTTVTGTYAP